MKSSLYLTLFSLIGFLLTEAAASGVTCDTSHTLKSLFSNSNTEEYTSENFERWKTFYQGELLNAPPLRFTQFPAVDAITTPTQKLAFIEAANSIRNDNPLNLEKFLETASQTQKDAALKIANSLKYEEGFELSQVRTKASDLYRLVNTAPPSWRFNLDKTANALIEERVNQMLMHENLEHALADLNLLRTPRMRENFRIWSESHPNISQLASTVGVDAVLAHLGGSLSFAAKLPQIQWFTLRNEMLETVSRDGFGALNDLLLQKNRFGLSIKDLAKVEAATNYGAKIYRPLCASVAAYYVASHWHDTKKTILLAGRLALGSARALKPKNRNASSQETAEKYSPSEKMQFQASVDGRVEFNRPLDPPWIWDESKRILEDTAARNHQAPPTAESIRQFSLNALKSTAEASQKKTDSGDKPIEPAVISQYQSWLSSQK